MSRSATHTSPAAVAAAVFPALLVAHDVGDHWVQTHSQACEKGLRGWRGRRACARHVATITATKAVVLEGWIRLLGIRVDRRAVAAALAVDGVAHYIADRRTPLLHMADVLQRWKLVPGKGDFARLGDGAAAPTGTGAYALDQSWHHAWLLIATGLIAAFGTTPRSRP